jgi:hypothetical protein
MEMPLPSFETLTKVSGWIGEQATTWLMIVRSPLTFLSGTDINSTAVFGRSIGFVAFILVVTEIISLPIDALMWHFNVLEVTYQLSNFVLSALSISIFSFAVLFFGRMLRGKGEAVAVITSMFYAAAFYPFVNLAGNYITVPASDFQKYVMQVLARGFSQADMSGISYSGAVAFTITSWIQILIVCWLIAKLVPIVKFVHKIGAGRAFIVIALAGCIEQVYEVFIWVPLIMGLAKNAPP